MAAKKQKNEAEALDDDVQDGGVDLVFEDDDIDLQDMIEQLGGESGADALLKVYKVDARKKPYFIEDYYPADLPLEQTLRDSWGGGEYQVKIFMPTPSGSKSLRKIQKLYIAERAKEPDDKRPPPAPAAPVDLLAEMRSMIADMQRSNTEILMKFMELQAQGKNSSPVAEIIQAVAAVKSMTEVKGQDSPLQLVRDMLDLKREVQELAEPPAPTDLNGTLMHGLNTLIELAREQRQHAQPAPAPTVSPSQQPQVNNMGLIKMREHIISLCQQAARDRLPQTYAEVTLDQTPDEALPQLREFVGADNAAPLATMIKYVPEVATYRDWFGEFLDCLRGELTEGAADDKSASNDDHNADGGAAPVAG